MRDSHWEPQKTAIERYWEALQTFRACFANQDARTVQKDAFNAMKQLIALCIEDICALIGSPPCHYDLRAMGSLGREEMCPYSDLEWMFLIENKQHRPYFERMLGLLELQIASFGETQGLPLVFTCLANPSGFHLDPSPLQEKRLMQTPGHMAQLQQRTTYAGNDIECTTLKTISLYQTTPQLYLEYQEHLKLIRKDFPFPFFNICKQRIRDFSLAWNHHFDRKTFTYNIKEQFVETLYHPLSDLALYLGINSTNTLEIADALIDRKVLPKKMRDLLKESISLIYQIRVRNHQQYGTQEDRAGLNSSEIDTLEKCYWQILIPLHTCLKKLIDPKEPHGQYFEELCRTKDTQALYVSQARQRQIEALPSESGPPSLNRKGDEEDRFGKVAAGQKSNLEAGWSITKQLNGAASILDAVLHLSDSSTTRPIYTVKMDALQASIIAITSPPSFSVPGEISVQIKAPYFPVVRSLWPPLTRKIMEGLDLKNDYSNSAHRVCRLQYGMHDLHLKQTPSNPLMEYAIHSLVSRIAGEYTPPTSLVRFDVEQQGQKKSYPVLISQTIPGETLKTAWPKATTNRSYTWNLLVAILIKPQDGRLSNYILHEQDLFCIDNDLAFVEPVIRSGLFRTVHFSAAPFCLFPLSTPLDQEVLKEFAALDAVGICKAWVEEVIEKEKEYIQLFTEEERKTLYQKEGCTLSILLKEGTFSTLNLQFWQLQNAIQAAINQNEILTAGDLLQQLVSLTNEKVGSYVYKAYNKTRPTPEKKQQAALRRRQDNSVTAVEYYKNCLGKIPSFDEIETLKKYSLQESSKELFHAFAIESEHAFWKNNQGKSALGVSFEGLNDPIRETKILLSMNEIMKDVYQKVFSLSFYFTKQLDTNTMRSFLHPNLEKIDLRSCENIDNNTVWLIQKECPILKELIVINCPKITGIGESFFSWLTFTHLETLVIAYTPCSKLLFKAPKLRLLNVSHNPKLVYLDFDAPLLFQIKAKGSEKIQFSDSAKESIVQALAKTPKNLATAHVSILSALEYASEELKNDKEFMLAAVQRYGSALQYASEELKSDKEFMLAVVERNGSAFLQYASEKLKSDKEFMLAAVQRYGSAIEYASEKLKSDKEFMLAAVQRYGSAIEYASEELKSDRDFVLAAAVQSRLALRYASEELKSDREIVLVALEQSGLALEYASEELKSDREIVLVALEQSGLALEYASEEFKSDREIVL
ncbi:MAG: DUF4116 domain-containing protein, partial [Parachlamydiaceae bacterium]